MTKPRESSKVTTEYTITSFNPQYWNEFEHRQAVFTRLARAGDGRITPISQVLQLWDVATDSLIIELTLTKSLDPKPQSNLILDAVNQFIYEEFGGLSDEQYERLKKRIKEAL